MTADRPRTDRFERLFELEERPNHTVILLVSVVDRRLVPALRFIARLGYADARALHVSVDAGETRQLAADWMNLGLCWLPLHVGEARAGDLPASARHAVQAVQKEPGTAPNLTVVVPEVDSRRWWHPLLHACKARRIVLELQSLPGVTAVIVPVRVPHSRSA